MNIGELIQLPFMQRAILGGMVVAVLAALMGVLMVLKRAAFFSDAVAHASLAGVAIGLLIGVDPLVSALIYAIGIAWVIPVLQNKNWVPLDSLLGLVLPFSMGLGVILLSFLPGYRPELMSFLFGNILAITWRDLIMVGAAALVVLVSVLGLWKRLIFVVFDPVYAKLCGIKVDRIEMIFNILLAVTVVIGIRLVGIILINALLVIPASIVRLYARSMKEMFTWTPVVAVLITGSGILVSLGTNLPTGPVISVVAGGVFVLALAALRVFKK